MRKVLIESDWNLKEIRTAQDGLTIAVLIESDWNLKIKTFKMQKTLIGINRIRLEFKVHARRRQMLLRTRVLIESDWNLKALGYPRYTR